MIPSLEFVPGGTEELRGVLARLHEELEAGPADLLVRLSDMWSDRAVEAFDEAASVPLEPATIQRKTRGSGGEEGRLRRYAKAGKGPRSKRKRLAGIATSLKPLGESGLGQGLRGALTVPFEDREAVPTAMREFSVEVGSGMTVLVLRWGSRGAVDYSGDHVFGTKHMVARLELLDPKKHRTELEEAHADVIGAWMGERLEAAGAPVDWIQAATGGRF